MAADMAQVLDKVDYGVVYKCVGPDAVVIWLIGLLLLLRWLRWNKRGGG